MTEDNQTGRYGTYGGQFIPETLMSEIERITAAYNHYKADPEFLKEFHDLLNNYANRPSLLYFAEQMTADLGGAQIYFKREDLNHTGAHKINNVIGQALLAKRMGKTRLIAETGAGQHGVATATIAALFNMDCEVFMGKEDTDRQRLNVYRMELLGAKVHAVTTGTQVLKDAVTATMQEWTRRVDDTFYVMGSAVGPYPFPQMVHDFQSVISKEAKQQLLQETGKLPDAVVACVGGGSNAIGSFADFIDDPSVKLYGVEAAGDGVDTDRTAATIERGSDGIFHGMKSIFLQDKHGQIDKVYSISAGLDYPGIGPEHAALAKSGRAEYVGITDAESVDAFEYIAKTEGIIAAVESCHAVAYVEKLAPTMRKDQIIICTISGRGDKDVASIAKYRGVDINE
ncbi:tryptophan synthase subunit beta [Loigolactobacillus bifermentans]|jgi:tryptophan synthase beta chain|uniref:Tryptophan synthase beta chain n=1 Tax=Loigolactobacillus bifermentans DSM 20003 TaxID=1423726 RepID=A0A0R1GKV4_9LACO|nr:tryptophan synthase subunit beta [Loigolactobacillus bifermentans]KRK34669.1 tryptophan synthase subunit beta [Loigolactobacillus bifermentans DSM 20003]QGG61065.1 tryptophan synthase subunit beta [Loigolactobacillus bifermentans]